jgi:hypothetical protein
MTLQTNAFTSYSSVGLREDLSDTIFNVDKAQTNLASNLKHTKAKQKTHEWQTDVIPAMATNNAQLEGDVWAAAATTATTRLTNVCQIAYKVFAVTASEEAMDKAGRDSEIAYQAVKFGKALKRDIEGMMFINNAKAAGNATTVREFGSILSYIATNDSLGGSGASPTGDGTDARTDGTQRAFTETLLQDTVQLIWAATGGGMEDLKLYLGGFNKRVFSGFTGVATKFQEVDNKRIMATAAVYESDFGEITCLPNPNMRSRDALLLNLDFWAIADLRPMRSKEVLQGQFDGEARVILWEGTLESRNEKASGGVFDLTTS